jgi:ribonuclease HI
MDTNTMNMLTIHFDGACEPVNPGGVATCGWVIDDDNGELASGCKMVKHGAGATNNLAEWCALGLALRWVLDNANGQYTGLRILGDSMLVIKQLKGQWKCNKEHLRELRDRCKEILREITCPWTATWIPREQNERADELSRRAYFEATGRECLSR